MLFILSSHPFAICACVRTYNGLLYATFRECAIAKDVLDTDDEWRKTLEEYDQFETPSSLRDVFVIIIVFCSPHNVSA